jgi:hypothetical protein
MRAGSSSARFVRVGGLNCGFLHNLFVRSRAEPTSGVKSAGFIRFDHSGFAVSSLQAAYRLCIMKPYRRSHESNLCVKFMSMSFIYSQSEVAVDESSVSIDLISHLFLIHFFCSFHSLLSYTHEKWSVS